MFSVLMAVCGRDHPSELEEAIASIVDQTLVPGQIVIVKDGDIGGELDAAIDTFVTRFPELFLVIGYAVNQGPAYAWNKGLENCTYDLVARMDSDDIARPERFRLQYEYMQANPGVDLLGGYIQEFEVIGDQVVRGNVRDAPLTSDGVAMLLKKRNSLNHVTVMFRKQAVIDSGWYQQINNHVDYFLWVRMALNNCVFANLTDVLVDVRVSQAQMGRRGGYRYLRSELQFYGQLVRLGFISPVQGIVNVAIRLPFRIAPLPLRRKMYKALRGS